VAARRQAAQEHTLSHPRFTHLVLAPAPAASLEGLAAAAGAQAANSRFTHLALAGTQPAPAASLQDRAAAADPQPAPAQEQCTFERAYADFAELGARLDRLNADTPEAAARDARIYAETLLSMVGATTWRRGTCARKSASAEEQHLTGTQRVCFAAAPCSLFSCTLSSSLPPPLAFQLARAGLVCSERCAVA